MSAPLKKFFDALNVEESKFIPNLAKDNLGIFLRCAINELDRYYYNLVRADEPNEEQQEQFYILQLGVTRLIQLALDARKTFDVPVVMFTRRRELTVTVLEMVSALGMIQHGRRVAQTIALGVGKIEQVGENEFLITFPENLIDDDYYEKSVLQHYIFESRRMFAEITMTEAWKELKVEVDEKLYELVYTFEKHYIGYGADPLLDDFFFGLAYHEIQLQEGFDTFHYATRFGGIRFQNYMLALTFVMSNYIRHERFAETLVKKDTSIRLENILTISSDTDEFIESIRDSVNYFGAAFESFDEIDLDSARRIFKVLSCGRENTALLAAPGSPLPPIVQCSDQGCIKCLTGAHSEPVRFLLESLRHHFTKDYDSNQRAREGSLQRAVRRVLNDTFEGLDYRENITVRLDGKVMTDVDLVILDERTGIVILCQLKHQELYGFNLHAKRVRTDRLKTQVADWLAALKKWRAAVGDGGVRDSLRLSKRFPDLLVYQLIISKHFAYPLQEVVTDRNTVYANWTQFFNANELAKRDHSVRSLDDLIRILRDHQTPPETIQHLPEPTSRWTINELTFVTKQEETSK